MSNPPEAAVLFPATDANKSLGISVEEELDCLKTLKWHFVAKNLTTRP